MSTQSANVSDFLPDGSEPVFAAPWEARAFALTVKLHERGVFSWSQWSEYLAKAIDSAAEKEGSSYYESWLQALETLLRDSEVVGSEEYLSVIRQFNPEPSASDHQH